MYRAEVRNDYYVYVIDTATGQERQIGDPVGVRVLGALVTGDDEVTITYDQYGGSDTKFCISTGNRF